jgi:predicted Ser/Thr protein kinase
MKTLSAGLLYYFDGSRWARCACGDEGIADDDWVHANYKKNRYNFLSQKDFEKNDPPYDGEITLIKGEVRGGYIYGVKNAEGLYEYECRYDEGPRDREWMEAKDKEYLKQLLNTGKLKETEPDVWRLREIDKAQGTDIGEWWSQKLKLPNIGDVLKRSEQDYKRFIECEAEEARKKAEEERQRQAPPHTQKAFIDDEGQIKVTVTLIPYNTLTFGRCLGEGGFGTVYQGKWQYDEVAIKQLRMTSMSAETLAEFKSEASIMANLRHPRIIGFYGISVDTPGRYSIVMDYMAGGSLYNLLHNQQSLIWKSRHRIALDITSGLAHLHSKDILHRDLKSLNVLLDSQQRAKLTDFGLSRIKTETASTTATASSQSVGTLPWMAPELFKRRAKYTKNADMYSYGMVLWELASRKVPFSDAHNREILIQWLRDGEQEEIPQDCPTGFAKLIKWCWNQEPTRRPTIDQAANVLEVEPAEQSPAPSYRNNLDSHI